MIHAEKRNSKFLFTATKYYWSREGFATKNKYGSLFAHREILE